jgi:hypothetical protein
VEVDIAARAGHQDTGLGSGISDWRNRVGQAHTAAFAGTLATRIRLAPPRDPEFKGMVERTNGFFGFFETSFMPGRTFTSPVDFNTQLTEWFDRSREHAHGPRDRWASG